MLKGPAGRVLGNEYSVMLGRVSPLGLKGTLQPHWELWKGRTGWVEWMELLLILCMRLGLLEGEETHEYRVAKSVWRQKDQ